MKTKERRALEDFAILMVGVFCIGVSIFVSLPIGEATLFVFLIGTALTFLSTIDLWFELNSYQKA